MLFADAVGKFRAFLCAQGHAGPLVWIVPTDAMFWFDELLIRPSSHAAAHAAQLFEQAAQRGFGVSLEGIAKLNDGICCYVFAPDDLEDAGANFVAPLLTMRVRQNIRLAREPNPLLWWFVKRMASRRTRSRSLQCFGHDLDRRSLTTNG